MTEVTIPFVFPGEGMVIDGALITPDTPSDGDEALDHLSGYSILRQNNREQRRKREEAT